VYRGSENLLPVGCETERSVSGTGISSITGSCLAITILPIQICHSLHSGPRSPNRKLRTAGSRGEVVYWATPGIERARRWDIIQRAGEPGDRRLAFRKECRREESPDSSCGELARVGCGRATRLVTPGGCVTRSAKANCGDAATESATENKPPVSLDLGGRLAEKPQARQFWSCAFGKGEKVG